MGRTGMGVEVRERSIRLSFTFAGESYRRTLTLNGQPLAPTPANVKHAHRLASEIKDKIRLGLFVLSEYFPVDGDTAALTVASQLNRWMGTQRLENSTLAGYSSAVKFWSALIGDKLVKATLHSDILTALATRPDLSGKTVNNYVSVLREAFELAVLDKVIQANPVANVPRAKWQKPPVDPFTQAEAEAICEYMTKHYPAQVVNYTAFQFFTGLRTSEGAGIRWDSVDLRAKYIEVKQALVRGEEKDTTKTNAIRHVILNSRALAALKAQAEHTRMAGEHVFLDPRYSQPWNEERAYRRSYWTPALKALGIRYRRPYNTRHTYATIMLMQGMTPAFCAKQLGHSVEMFLRTYSKWLDGKQDDIEMARLELALSGKNPGKKAGNDGAM
ncbi:MAG: tyrosine-type recombinase/integrase [Pseudomonadota bacterium]